LTTNLWVALFVQLFNSQQLHTKGEHKSETQLNASFLGMLFVGEFISEQNAIVFAVANKIKLSY